MSPELIAQLIVIGFTFFMLLNSAAIMVYMERKVAAWIQQRYGPYLVGPQGALQPLADSRFHPQEWVVRADATHGKSKTYRRTDIFTRDHAV